VHLEVQLRGKDFSLLYPIESRSIEIAYQLNRTPEIVAAGAVGFAATLTLLYFLWPLGLLYGARHYNALTSLGSIVPGGKAILELLGNLMLISLVSTLPRVLDSWLLRYRSKLQARFDEIPACQTLDFFALPVRKQGAKPQNMLPSIESFGAETRQPRALLQFVGAGGAGKTSLAIQLARWARTGAVTSRR
jgi:hypothetical protein